MQELTSWDLEFYELSMIADDPKKLEQLQNRYFDPEFDEWLEEFDLEQSLENETQVDNLSNLSYSDEEDTRQVEINRDSDNLDNLFDEDYDTPVEGSEGVSDWEVVD